MLIDSSCDVEAFNLCLRDETQNMAVAWEFLVGLSNDPSVGCINSAASASDANVAMTFTKHSSNSAAS